MINAVITGYSFNCFRKNYKIVELKIYASIDVFKYWRWLFDEIHFVNRFWGFQKIPTEVEYEVDRYIIDV